jgi:metal-responsive CopG/Arc/MetJ family transcriptional regulator
VAKIKIDDALYDRVKRVADTAGYASPEEFITYVIERELDKIAPDNVSDQEVMERLRGLGYIE